jgi:hypothetical protein
MSHKLASLIFVASVGLLSGQVGRPGRIVGRTLDAAGKPVPGIGLVLTGQFNGSQGAGFQPVKYRTRTTRDGLFNFDLLAPGRYKVCLDSSIEGGAAGEFLNPCTWIPDATMVNVVAGSQPQMDLVLVRGVTVTIRVEDPGKHLDKHVGKTKDADFDLGFLTAQNLYQPARLRSKKDDEQIYEIQLPAGVSHRVLTSSKHFDVEDVRGPQPVKADGVQLPVQALERTSLAVNAPPGLVLRVKGVKPGK